MLRRIHTRQWKPGTLLPNEADIATELGCARSTVNRALQAVADEGLLERRRRGGTRVVMHPERKATFKIPIIRLQIEQSGYSYDYVLTDQQKEQPPETVKAQFASKPHANCLHLTALHKADGKPYVLEDRWIDTHVLPEAENADFSALSPNQWLVENVPFSGGEVVFAAANANAREAKALKCKSKEAIFRVERITRNHNLQVITMVRLSYVPGYKMQLDL